MKWMVISTTRLRQIWKSGENDMRVLQINSVSGIRSTGRICTDLADMLIEQGNQCIIAYGRETVPEKYQALSKRIGTQRDVYAHVLKTRALDRTGFGSKGATKKFVNWIKEYSPDVIHLHNLHGYYIHIEILFDYLSQADIPIVWTLHDCWAFTGHCSHFSYIQCNLWKSGCERCPQLKRYPRSWCYDNSKNNWQKKKELFTSVKNMTLVSPSRWLADLTKESFLGTYPIMVIPNGIDVQAFKPTPSDFRKKHQLDEKIIVLGVASVWDERKGLQDMLDIAKALDDRYQVVLVGITEKQKKEIDPKIIAITRTNNTQELAEIYTAADVFVNPTYEEVFGLVNIEAQACGTPVITYATGGSPETLLPFGGRVLSQKGAPSLLSAILEMENKNKFPLKAVELSKDLHYQQYLNLYNQGHLKRCADVFNNNLTFK